jgi:hypothetical protein
MKYKSRKNKESQFLRRIFGPKSQEINLKAVWRILHN